MVRQHTPAAGPPANTSPGNRKNALTVAPDAGMPGWGVAHPTMQARKITTEMPFYSASRPPATIDIALCQAAPGAGSWNTLSLPQPTGLSFPAPQPAPTAATPHLLASATASTAAPPSHQPTTAAGTADLDPAAGLMSPPVQAGGATISPSSAPASHGGPHLASRGRGRSCGRARGGRTPAGRNVPAVAPGNNTRATSKRAGRGGAGRQRRRSATTAQDAHDVAPAAGSASLPTSPSTPVPGTVTPPLNAPAGATKSKEEHVPLPVNNRSCDITLGKQIWRRLTAGEGMRDAPVLDRPPREPPSAENRRWASKCHPSYALTARVAKLGQETLLQPMIKKTCTGMLACYCCHLPSQSRATAWQGCSEATYCEHTG
jgi:hypothetical protein